MVPENGRGSPRILSLKKNMTFSAPGTKNEILLEDLVPYTLYNISMIAQNKHGKSLPSYHLLVLTLSRKEARLVKEKLRQESKQSAMEEVSFTTPSPKPKLPDFKKCCNNIPNATVHGA